MARSRKPTKTAALSPPRRPRRLPASGRLMAEGLEKVAPPPKLGVELLPNPNGARFLSRNYRVPAPLKAGVLKEHNRYGTLARYGDQENVYEEEGGDAGGHVDAVEEPAAGGDDVYEEEGADAGGHVDALE